MQERKEDPLQPPWPNKVVVCFAGLSGLSEDLLHESLHLDGKKAFPITVRLLVSHFLKNYDPRWSIYPRERGLRCRFCFCTMSFLPFGFCLRSLLSDVGFIWHLTMSGASTRVLSWSRMSTMAAGALLCLGRASHHDDDCSVPVRDVE